MSKLKTSSKCGTEHDKTLGTQLEAQRSGFVGQTRVWWQRVPFVTCTALPPLAGRSLDDAQLSPEATASFFSHLTFHWVTPLLNLGYARPLEATDLWKLQSDRDAAQIGEQILQSFDRRSKEAALYNAQLAEGQVGPGLKGVWWSITGRRREKELRWRETTGKQKASLVWAINDSVKWWFWSAGLLKVMGDTAQVTSPLVMKAIITFAGESYFNHKAGLPVPNIGKGIGLTFALLAMQVIGSVCSQQYSYRALTTGVLIRGGLITAIYNRSLRLSSLARSTLTNGKLVNHISTDVSRLDFCAGFFHASWTSPIQLAICLALLIVQLGVSSLAGFAIFFLAIPVQTILIKRYFAVRGDTMRWTDKRVKLLQEVLGGMKIIKYFTWEVPSLARITDYRRKEVANVRSLLLLKSANSALGISMPTLASIIGLVTYSATNHSLQPAVIFTALSLFNLLRIPLMFLPLSINSIADAKNAAIRLQEVFEAGLLDSMHEINEALDAALEVKGASFTWDAPPNNAGESEGGNFVGKQAKTLKVNAEKKQIADIDEKAVKNEAGVFKVTDVTMTIPRGQLAAIVGPVGSGKSSLLQGLIGEMRKTAGSVVFGGSIAYCPQIAWIQNTTIRENICFGRPFEEAKYWKAVHDSCLGPDLDMLPNGDLTEVGEKGISLSGGQKQRISICRAVYCDTDVQIFDDPLSALDAHVGKAVFRDVLQSSSSGKTRILVTHALNFLPHVDYIYVIEGGKVAEHGSYQDLMTRGDSFSRFVKEFGSTERKEEENKPEGSKDGHIVTSKVFNDKDGISKDVVTGAGLMQEEERSTGAVTWAVYKAYIKAGHGALLLPFLLVALVLMTGANVFSSYWLVWWQEKKWDQPQGFYMGIFGAFGGASVIAGYLVGAIFALFTYFSSQKLHKNAVNRVLHAPMSFFETTPLGRIMNRFSKDIDTIDNTLGDAYRILASIASTIVGAIILISVLIPWFLIAIVFILVVYVYIAAFYRASARELKRLDAILRSSLYSHFSESLSGLATIRAYGEMDRFRSENEKRVDVENRAYWLTATNQHWLGLRLDFLGYCMTFVVVILTVATRFTLSPAQTGVLISYIMSIQQAFSFIIRQVAEVENSMNSVERISHYAQSIEQEAPHSLPNHKPPPNWPASGSVELNDLVMKYRPELPAVLKGISLDIKAREKVGFIGRTGAGKSSIMTALFRLVEPTSGSIIIDGVDASTIGLTDLRNALAIIPQDPLLFAGTIRSNLDPFGRQDDATLWDALKRASLVSGPITSAEPTQHEQLPSGAATLVNKFDLDAIIEDEGGNLSVGQRCLVSLARALVKNARIIILDEATASVDYETDRKIQDTIAHQFKDRTVLCIAHRLRTIIFYDRICVLDGGKIAEFDTPANLFSKPGGIFRGMCEQSSITLNDIMAEKIGRHETRDD